MSFTVTASNPPDETTDEANLVAAIAALRAAGGGEIVIDGMLLIDQGINLDSMPSRWVMRGARRVGCGFKCGPSTWFHAGYNYGLTPANFGWSWYACTANMAEGQTQVTLPKSTTIAAGDCLAFRSVDQIPLVPPHNGPAAPQVPGCMRRAIYVADQGTTYLVALDRGLPTAMTVANAAEFGVIPRASQSTWHWEDLTFARQVAPDPHPWSVAQINSGLNFLQVGNAYDSTFANILLESIGAVSDGSYNSRWYDLRHTKSTETTAADAARYTILPGWLNWSEWHNPYIEGVGHVFATGGPGSYSKGNYASLSAFLAAYPSPPNSYSTWYWYWFNTTTQTYWTYNGSTFVDSGKNYLYPSRLGINGRGGCPTYEVIGGTVHQQYNRGGLSTHAEGADCTFRDVLITLSDGATYPIGGESRSLRTRWVGCTFRGAAGEGGYGINNRGGPYTIVEDCVFDGMAIGVRLDQAYQTNYSQPGSYGAIIRNNRFRNCQSAPILIVAKDAGINPSDNIVIEGNTFERGNATSVWSNPSRALIVWGSNQGSGHRIRGNFMPKLDNLAAIDVANRATSDLEVVDNPGLDAQYPSNSGFVGTSAAAFAEAYRLRNHPPLVLE